MKNNQQKGSAILIVIIVILLGIIGWMYFKKGTIQSIESTSTTEILTSTTTSADVNKNVLTEQDILNTTYTISANFNGKKTAPQNVRLPYIPNEEAAQQNKERLYITKDGSVVTDNKAGGEMFYISSYKFSDSSKSEATVYVAGNFGASGYDNRTFIVTKVNGQVITQEK